MKQVPLSELKDDFSRYLRLAAQEEIIITRHGQPAGVLVGFKDLDAWLEYRLEHDPGFIARVAAARDDARAGRKTRLEDIPDDFFVARDDDEAERNAPA